MSFGEFMRTALYDPSQGYYMRSGAPHADFFTSVTRHPSLFGALLARHLDDVWEALRRPSPFVVYELGAGDGRLAAQIAQAAPQHPWGAELRYFGIEISARGRRAASRRVPAARFRAALSELPRADAAAVLSNEFFDAQPASLGRRSGDGWVEERIGLRNDRLALADAPAGAELRAYAERYGQALPAGGRFEARDGVDEVYAHVSARAARCVMTTIDFGGWACEVHGPRLRAGTLLAYRRHQASEDLLADPGGRDLASHVNFSELVDVARRRGLATARMGSQADFLAALGVGEYLVDLQGKAGVSLRDYAEAREAVFQLVSPTDLGRFRVLVQARAADISRVRGLGAPVSE